MFREGYQSDISVESLLQSAQNSLSAEGMEIIKEYFEIEKKINKIEAERFARK